MPNPTVDLKAVLKPGMAYADFREKVLSAGWEPVKDADCLENVVGSDFKEQCAAGSELCKACGDLPELSAYSGDGHAEVRFSKGSHLLEATALGELEYRDDRGEDAGLQLLEWSTSKK